MEKLLYGKTAIQARRDRFTELHGVVKGNRGWIDDFKIRYPHFDTQEGLKMLNAISRGTCDDAEMLRCFEDFVVYAREQQPAWFKKQIQVIIPPSEKVLN